MIVFFMIVSFVIGCFDRMCRSDVSFYHSFWPCHYGFLTFPCLWEISFSGQMISGTLSWLLGLDTIFN